jgi:ABC-type phosphate transport system substrate-binding protein
MRIHCATIGLILVMAGPVFAEDLVVIVHADRHVRLTLHEVAQIYLKKRRFWERGERIVPVNRNSGCAAREGFTRRIFGEDAAQLVIYWNRQYFRGVLPPATLASDEAVKRFVAREPLAIGYIPARLADASVKVVLRLEDEVVSPASATPGPSR